MPFARTPASVIVIATYVASVGVVAATDVNASATTVKDVASERWGRSEGSERAEHIIAPILHPNARGALRNRLRRAC